MICNVVEGDAAKQTTTKKKENNSVSITNSISTRQEFNYYGGGSESKGKKTGEKIVAIRVHFKMTAQKNEQHNIGFHFFSFRPGRRTKRKCGFFRTQKRISKSLENFFSEIASLSSSKKIPSKAFFL
jgi:hypothetical protein